MTTKAIPFLIMITLLTIISCTQETQQIKYLGQKIPKNQPEIFGEGIISVDSTSESMISVTNDGLTIYFMRYYKDENGNTNGAKSLYTRYDGNKWTDLELRDRKMFYKTPRFVNDSLAIMEQDGCIWKSIKVNDKIWTEPMFIDSMDLSGQNGVTDWVITANLILFYVQNGDIKTAKINKNKIIKGKEIQGFGDFKTRHIGLSPNGDYLICDGFIEGVNNGWIDSYISFHKSDENWTYPVHLDSNINTKNFANYFPRISPDGEVFFFSRQDSTNRSEIYWMGTKIFDKYKNGL